MKIIIYSLLFAVVISPNIVGQSKLNNQVDSVSYLIGQTIATNVMRDLSEANKALVIQGLSDALNNQTPLCSDPGNAVLSAYFQKKSLEKAAAAEKENLVFKEAGEVFLAENRKDKDVKVTASGLQYKVLIAGDGNKPVATSKVKVHYAGTLPTGETFDSSYDRGEPIEFGLNQVIPGWTEGLQLMSVGSKFKFFIPQELAYGANPQPGGIIKPYMALVFEVELLGFTNE
jgi:FKBP-type peptidyl-prolyl cis-trans isomerase FklB